MQKDRPLLMSEPMVRAIREGRKTETRRVVQPAIANILTKGSVAERELVIEDCPYGRPGDTFWVRESWHLLTWDQRVKAMSPNSSTNYTEVKIEYKAGGPNRLVELFESKDREQAERAMLSGREGWRPGIHMPKWACRMHLELTQVRAERLRFINENGVRAEGLQQCTKDGMLYKWGWEGLPWTDWYRGGAVEAYAGLRDKINAGRGYTWESNPWVFVLVFKQLERN